MLKDWVSRIGCTCDWLALFEGKNEGLNSLGCCNGVGGDDNCLWSAVRSDSDLD